MWLKYLKIKMKKKYSLEFKFKLQKSEFQRIHKYINDFIVLRKLYCIDIILYGDQRFIW